MDRLHDFTTNQTAREFSKAIFAAALGSRHGISHVDALNTLDGVDTFTKAAVLAQTTGNLSALVAAGRAWLSLLQRRTVLGRLTGTLAAPPNITVPTPSTYPTPAWVLEGAPIPAARVELAGPQITDAKFGCIQAFTEELFRIGGDRAISLVEAISLRALTHAEDTLLLSATAAVANGAPAGLLYGLTAIGGGSPASIADIEELWSATSDGDPDRPYFVTSPRAAMYLATRNTEGFPVFPTISAATGGTIGGVPVLLSKAAGPNLILIDAAMLAVSDEGLLVEPSRIASLQLLDNPTNSSATATATNMISSFQTNTALVKYLRMVSWVKLTTDAVQFIELPILGSPA